MKKIMIIVLAAMSLAAVGCKKKGGMAEAMNKMGEFKDKMCACKDAKCAEGVSDELTKWSQEMAKTMQQPPKMSEADQKRAAEMGEQMGKCMQTAMGAGAAPEGSTAAPTPAPGAGPDGLPPECAEYKATVEKLMGCQKMPQQQRDTLKKAFDDASAGWANMPAESKPQLATSCKAGTDAVTASAKGPCGW